MYRSRRVALTFALLLLAGLAVAKEKKPAYKYPPVTDEERAQYSVSGTGSIEGQVFMKTRGGEVRYGAGSEVTLDPATKQTSIWWKGYALRWNSREVLPPQEEEFHQLRKKTFADGEGRFRFEGLPPGKYYVRSGVLWEVFGRGKEGGLLAAEVDLTAGQKSSVVLQLPGPWAVAR